MKLTHERLCEVLSYDKETGNFTWITRTSYCVNVGDVAGSKRKDGYLLIRIDRERFYAHRLAWFFENKEFPKYIDHINGNPSDNRIANLRKVTNAVNGQNQRRARVDNKCGLLGVSRNGEGFIARIFIDKKTKCLGTYSTAIEAYEAYVKEKRTQHEGCTI